MFDDSSSYKKTISFKCNAPKKTSQYYTFCIKTSVINTLLLLLLYLTEKVGQDLLREGGCHRAELEREKSMGLFII